MVIATSLNIPICRPELYITLRRSKAGVNKVLTSMSLFPAHKARSVWTRLEGSSGPLHPAAKVFALRGTVETQVQVEH